MHTYEPIAPSFYHVSYQAAAPARLAFVHPSLVPDPSAGAAGAQVETRPEVAEGDPGPSQRETNEPYARIAV